MTIGLAGLVFCTGNKGCEALSYSFMEILNCIAASKKTTFKVVIFQNLPIKAVLKGMPKIEEVKKRFGPSKSYSNITWQVCFIRNFKGHIWFEDKNIQCDYVFDFTQGDSFTDIYGNARFVECTQIKKKFIDKGWKLILGPQTIGPFSNNKNRAFAADVISKCEKVYCRDHRSYEYITSLCKANSEITTDVAIFLPFNSKKETYKKRRIGVNVSGLLWDGGYTRNNQFNLTVDYQQYIRSILSTLCKDDSIQVHLICHATSERKNFPDNDWKPAKLLHNEYKNTVLVPKFKNPIEAKSYISGMDLFIGSRMHATIAALSTHVPVIPVSYSRKFEGLFESLKYRFIISATKVSTDEAIKTTLEWINNPEMLINDVNSSAEVIEVFKREMLKSFDELIK